jgi:nitrate reductase gamma subunit
MPNLLTVLIRYDSLGQTQKERFTDLERPEFWGIYPWLIKIFYALAVFSLSVFILGLTARLRAWSEGEPGEERFLEGLKAPSLAFLSFKTLFTSGCLLARRSMRISPTRAVVLLAIKWSFLALFLGTVLCFVNFHVSGFLKGPVYHVYKAALDWAGILFVAAVGFCILRRATTNKLPSSGYDYFMLFLLLLTGLTAFVAQGIRLGTGTWPDARYSPAGLLFMAVFDGMDGEARILMYNVFWGAHVLLALFFIAYIPYSRIFHVFAAQITTYAAAAREKWTGIS